MAVREASQTIYECCICLSLPGEAVHQCRNGHLFCSTCLQQHRESDSSNRTKCPTCRVALGSAGIRCISAEHAIAIMPSACAHCAAPMTRGEVAAHEARCPKAPVKCASGGCTWEGPRKEVERHEQDCVHLVCSRLRDELKELERKHQREQARNEDSSVSQHCMHAYRDCARHPPGAGFRVELVLPDADVQSVFSLKPGRAASKRWDRLLCLVPGPAGTAWAGGCCPVLVQYGPDLLKPPVCKVPPREGPHEAPRPYFYNAETGPDLQCPVAFMHSNVYPCGTVCLTTLIEKSGWHPSLTLAEVSNST